MNTADHAYTNALDEQKLPTTVLLMQLSIVMHIIIIINNNIKKRSAVQGWERVIYTLSVRGSAARRWIGEQMCNQRTTCNPHWYIGSRYITIKRVYRVALSKLLKCEGGAGAEGAILPYVDHWQLISTLKIGADCCQLCQYKLTKPNLMYPPPEE